MSEVAGVTLSQERHDLLTWLKARASQPFGMCVEVAQSSEGVAVRDSKTPENGVLVFTREEFAAFLDGAKRGEFDHLV